MSPKRKKKDGVKRKPGRPLKQSTGRKAANMRMKGMPQAEEGTQEHNVVSTLGGSIRERASIAESFNTGFQQLFNARRPQDKKSVPLFLDSLNLHKRGWRQIATVRTLDVTFWFDLQYNDFNSHDAVISAAVDITWLGHFFIAPKGAHARRFLVSWKDPLPVSSTGKELAIMNRKPVARWNYICNGTCSVPTKSKRWRGFTAGESDEESTAISSQFTSDEEFRDEDGSYATSENGEEEGVTARPQGLKCSGKVKLRLEVLANNLELVHIWQQNEHAEANTEHLNWSRGLHNDIGHALRLFGIRPYMVMKTLVEAYGFPADIAGRAPEGTSIMFPNTFPAWRVPTYRQVSNMMPAIKRRARLDWDPFRAVSLMFERHPDKMYFYEKHDDNLADSDSNFSCAISTDFSLEALILHGSQDGVGLDTSWRNKNEHRAAVSFLIAVDRQGHLTPGAVLISANVKAATIEKFLNKTEERVVQRARTIVAGGLDCIVHPNSRDRNDIFGVCQAIIKNDQWFIKKWMIDKSASLLSGITKHDTEATILVCQFHIVQAIIRLDGGNGRILGAPSIPYPMKYEIVKAFRQVQRCRTMDEWATYHANFGNALRQIIMNSPVIDEPLVRDEETFSDDEPKGGQTRLKTSSKPPEKGRNLSEKERRGIFDFMKKFFDDNWFTSRWLKHVTDMGLPDGETRDGTFYTNNWCESAFHTFDKVFLGLTKNKRLDRLVAIIIGDFFPFYETIGPKSPCIPWEILNTNFEAYELWSTNKIEDLGARVYSVTAVTHRGTVEAYIVDLSLPKCDRKCPDWNQSGKACLHIRAARLLEVNGPVSKWEGELTTSRSRSKHAIQLRRKKAIAVEEPSQKDNPPEEPVPEEITFPMDGLLDEELEKMIRDLGKDSDYVTRPQLVRTHSPTSNVESRPRKRVKMSRLREPDGFRSAWSLKGGKPGRIPPMAPWRKKSAAYKQIRFSRKPGKQPVARLHHNSLFTTQVSTWKHSVKGKRSLAKHSRSKVPTSTQLTGPLSEQSFGEREEIANKSPKLMDVAMPKQTVSPNDTVSGLTEEDVEISSVNMTRWKDKGYTLRVDEMEVLVEILNQFSVTMDARRWYGISGSGFERSVLGALTSEKPTEFETRVRDELMGPNIDMFVFLEVTAQTDHWTCWEYSISSKGSVTCCGVNSLLSNHYLEVVDRNIHVSIMNAYVKLKYPQAPQNAVPLYYHAANTGLQTDDASCGFWAIFMAFLPLIHIPVDHLSLRSLPILRVKFWLGRFWKTYFTDIQGVHGKEIIDIHSRLVPQSTGVGLPEPNDIIARLPKYRKWIFVPKDISPLEVGDEERHFKRMENPEYQIVVARETLNYTEFGRLLGHTDSGWLSEAILNAYFYVFLKDLENERGVRGLQPPWHIASTTVTRCMATQLARLPFQPREVLRSQTLWFPMCNIFELDNLILPWHVDRPTLKHWMLIHVQPPHRRILIYDSLGTGIEQYHRLACQRVIKFLGFEYQKRYPTYQLPSDWQKNLDSFITQNRLLGPKQTDSASCGLFVIMNAEALCTYALLDESQVYSPTTVKEIRRRIALRLSREDYMLKEISYSPEPVPDATSRAPSLKPKSPRESELPDALKGSLEPKSESRYDEAMSSLPVMVWELWFRPQDKLYWPGRITDVDTRNKSCVIVIPSDIIPGAKVDENYVLNKSVFDIVHDVIEVTSLTPDQVAPIRWPAYLVSDSVPKDIREYANRKDPIEWDMMIAFVKKPLVNYLLSRLAVVTEIVTGDKLFLPDLTTDATHILKRKGVTVHQSHEFLEKHSRLLDAYDREMIRHLAGWEICKPPSKPKKDTKVVDYNWQLGFGAAILAYMAMAWYLGLTEEEVYELYHSAQLILPQSLAEQAWEPMSRVFNRDGLQNFNEFFREVTSSGPHEHKIFDFRLLPPHVTFSPGYLTYQSALNEISMEQPSTCDVATAELEEPVGKTGGAVTSIDVATLEETPLNQPETSETHMVSLSTDIPATSLKIRIPGGKVWTEQSSSVLARLRPKRKK